MAGVTDRRHEELGIGVSRHLFEVAAWHCARTPKPACGCYGTHHGSTQITVQLLCQMCPPTHHRHLLAVRHVQLGGELLEVGGPADALQVGAVCQRCRACSRDAGGCCRRRSGGRQQASVGIDGEPRVGWGCQGGRRGHRGELLCQSGHWRVLGRVCGEVEGLGHAGQRLLLGAGRQAVEPLGQLAQLRLLAAGPAVQRALQLLQAHRRLGQARRLVRTRLGQRRRRHQQGQIPGGGKRRAVVDCRAARRAGSGADGVVSRAGCTVSAGGSARRVQAHRAPGPQAGS